VSEGMKARASGGDGGGGRGVCVCVRVCVRVCLGGGGLEYRSRAREYDWPNPTATAAEKTADGKTHCCSTKVNPSDFRETRNRHRTRQHGMPGWPAAEEQPLHG
jgi:hypothetical protein